MAEREELTLATIAEERNVALSTVWRWVADGLKLADGSRLKLRSRRKLGRRIVYRDEWEQFVSTIEADDPLATDLDPNPHGDAARRERVDREAEALVG